MLLVASLLVGIPQGALADPVDQNTPRGTTDQEVALQRKCPVMIGNKIDPSIYTVYKGKKVYFCCETCKSAFGKNPGSYLARLPQFAPATVADVGEGADRAHADHVFSLAPLIKPTGILTLSLVGITVALGVLRRLKPRLLLKWHKIFGVAALISGAAHGAMVLVIH